ncbi:MAG TPA: hypothetical protein DEQ27_04400 [Prevotella sp.]|nr:hypothetical protein [Prevotella sp.]
MTTTKLLFAGVALFSLTLASCSQDTEVTAEPDRSEIRSSQGVRNLTRQLKEYDSQFTYNNAENLQPVTRLPKITYSKGDIVKIAISDVKGGLRGVGGGAGGVIVGAATSSLIKFGTITVKKLLWGYIKDKYLTPKVYRSNSLCQYADSIGYYHNDLEYAMYDADRSSSDKPSIQLVADANARLLTMSTGFNKDGGLTAAQILSISNELDVIRNTDENLSFTEYCNKLKKHNPEDSEYIDYCAEYIYTAVYANLSNLAEYTDNVIYQIQHSNVDVQDKQTLYSGIQIAYASILYSQNMNFKNISNR